MVKEVLFFIFIRHFSQDSHDFSQRWEKMRDFLGKRGVIFLFSLLFNFLFHFLLTFSQEMPDFSQKQEFFGEVVDNITQMIPPVSLK